MLGSTLEHSVGVRHLSTENSNLSGTLLPIGAYEPRWFMRAVHMNPAEAVQAHLDLGAPQSIGMHFGTFPMTTEGVDEPTRALKHACRARAPSAHRISDA